MSGEITDRGSALSKLPVTRWVLGGLLLVVEYVLAILLFDAERLPIPADSNTFGYLGEAMPLVIVVMTATLLVGSKPSAEERQSIGAALSVPRRQWPFLAAHLAAYAAALAITVFVFNSGLVLRHPWLWVALWSAAALASLILWVAAMLPRAAVRPLMRPLVRALVSGIVVGVVALAAGYATSALWRPMSRATLEVVAFLLGITGHQVTEVPEQLVVGTQSYEVFIDRPCSGYEGIGLIVVMLGVYLLASRRSLRFPNALALLPLGVCLIWLANSVRIAALIMVGTWISPDVAEGGFHSASGWLLFCVITLTLVATSRRYAWFSLEPTRKVGRIKTREGAYLLPLLFLIAASLLTALFTIDFDYLYPVPIFAALVPLWVFRSYYRELRWSWSWTAILLGVLAFAIWAALEPPLDQETSAQIPIALQQMPTAAAAAWLLARIVGSVVVVPIVEELAFRGYLLRRLIDQKFMSVSPAEFTIPSFLVSSVVFGLLHDRWLAGILVGMLFALAQYRRGRITDAITAHAVSNALVAGYVLLFGHWTMW